jgi:hypothetical protein
MGRTVPCTLRTQAPHVDCEYTCAIGLHGMSKHGMPSEHTA